MKAYPLQAFDWRRTPRASQFKELVGNRIKHRDIKTLRLSIEQPPPA
jgi:hypothetical protein